MNPYWWSQSAMVPQFHQQPYYQPSVHPPIPTQQMQMQQMQMQQMQMQQMQMQQMQMEQLQMQQLQMQQMPFQAIQQMNVPSLSSPMNAPAFPPPITGPTTIGPLIERTITKLSPVSETNMAADARVTLPVQRRTQQNYRSKPQQRNKRPVKKTSALARSNVDGSQVNLSPVAAGKLTQHWNVRREAEKTVRVVGTSDVPRRNNRRRYNANAEMKRLKNRMNKLELGKLVKNSEETTEANQVARCQLPIAGTYRSVRLLTH